MPAPVIVSGVLPWRVLLCVCLAAGAGVVIVAGVLFALLAQPRQHAGQPRRTASRPRAGKPLHHALVPGETPAGRSEAA